MSLNSLWRWFSRGPSSPIRKARAQRAGGRVRPHLELLENRVLPSVAPPAGLVAWYRAEGDASDFAGGHHGTLDLGTLGNSNPNLAFTAGKVGQAFLFDGVDDQISIPDDASLEPGSNFTIEAWVNPSSSGHGRPIADKRAGNNNSFTFQTTHAPSGPNNGLQFVVWIGGVQQEFLQTPAGVLENDTWQHVAAHYNGTWLRIFVDGVQQAESFVPGSIDDVSAPMVIGLNSVAAFAWHGAIDEISFYNRALSLEEIQAIYNAGAEGKDLPNTYDAAADFSLTGNPNGAWSYGWSATLGGAFTKDVDPRSNHPGPGVQSWYGPINGFFPAINTNTTDATVVVGSVTWQPGQMIHHPGPNGEYSVLRWTAPEAGEVEVSASFSGADSTTTDVHVLFNETTIADCDGNVNGFGAGPTCSQTLVVEIGDTIDFVVGIGNGSFSNDSTGVDAHITYVDMAPAHLYRAEGNALDSVGANHGTLQGGVAFAAGQVGQAFQFDGVDDSVDLGNWFNLETFSIGMWINPAATQVAFADIIDNNHTTFNNWVVQQDGSTTNRYVFGGASVAGDVYFNLTANSWQHLAMTREAGGVKKVYINGVLIDTKTDAPLNYNGGQFLRLGRWGGGGRNWNGLMDEVGIYDRALSAAEIQAVVAAGTVPTAADLQVTINDSPDPVAPGSNITYTITVTNNGPVDATNVTLTDTVPANTTFVSFIPLAGGTSTTPAVGSSGTITSTMPSLAAGASVSFILVVQVNPSADAGTISNSAVASGSPSDPNSVNNTASATTAVQLQPTDLKVVSITDLPDRVMIGENLTYTITVTNAGPGQAQTVVVSTATPVHTTFQSVTSPAGWVASTPTVGATGAITLMSVSLLAGASATFTVVVQVDQGLGDGTLLSNTVNVAGNNPDSNSANNSKTVTTTVDGLRTDLAVSITSDDMPEFEQGDIVHFDILLTNTSATALDASNVKLRFTSLGGVMEQSTKPPDWTVAFDQFTVDDDTIIFTPYLTTATFSAGTEARFRVEVQITADPLSSFAFIARVVAFGRDANTANDGASITKTVYGLPNDLRLRGSVQPFFDVGPGEHLSYTTTVTNLGQSPLNGVTLHVEARTTEGILQSLPLTFDATTSPGFSIRLIDDVDVQTPGSSFKYLGLLAAGASATLTLTTIVPEFAEPSSGWDILFVTSVTSAQPDPQIGNNVHSSVIELNDSQFSQEQGYDQARLTQLGYVAENDGSIKILLSRLDSQGEVKYRYKTQDLTAISGSDYNSVSGNDTIFPGFSGTISIPILDNPHLDGNRSFKLLVEVERQLGNGLIVTSTDSATITIFDDETEPPTATWKNVLGGSWTDVANWDGGFVPRLGDNVIIDIPDVDVTVRIPDGDFSIAALRSTENIVIDGGSLTINGAAQLANVDVHANAKLVIDTAEPVNITGDWNNAGRLSWTGSGNLNFTNGARLNNLAGGIFEIHPAEPVGAEKLGISFSGGGSLNNLAGGLIQIDTAEPIADIVGDWNNAGEINVRRGSLALHDGAGSGSFRVDAGADLNFAGNFSWNSGTTFAGAGVVRVDPPDSGFAIAVNASVSIPNLQLGGKGAFNVHGGALSLSGAGSSAGSITVDSGAALNFAGSYSLNAGASVAGNGSVHVRPTSSRSVTQLSVAANADVTLPNLEVAAGAELRVLGRLRSPATIRNFGTISGAGNIVGNVLNRGTVRPGLSPGILTITGNYTQGKQGRLVLEIGGTRPGTQYDQLRITGTAKFAGAVRVVLVHGFRPKANHNFRLIRAKKSIGRLVSANPAFVFSPGGAVRTAFVWSGGGRPTRS